MCSIVLQAIQVSELVCSLLGLSCLLLKKTAAAVTSVASQEVLYRCCKTAEIWCTKLGASLRILAGTRSGPEALAGLRLLSIF